MDAPPIDIGAATIAAIVARHRLGTRSFTPLRSTGSASSVYLLDDAFVLRVPRDHPAAIGGLLTERLALPLALAAGVRVARLIALDESGTLLPVPYAISERIPGEPLSALALSPEATPALWHQLGGDLARLHHGVAATGAAAKLGPIETMVDPRPWLAELRARQLVTAEADIWLRRWLDRLEPFARVAVPARLCHGDVNASNIMLDPATGAYLALIDWGGAGWSDPTWDFAPITLRAAPMLLAGYRAVAALDEDATAEARVLWHQLQLTIYSLHSGQQRHPGDAALRLARLGRDLRALLAQPAYRWLAELR